MVPILVCWSCPKTTNLLSHNSTGQKSEIKVSAQLVPSEDVRENLFHAHLLASDGLLAISGVLGLW